jgi:hypothetical protein
MSAAVESNMEHVQQQDRFQCLAEGEDAQVDFVDLPLRT